MSSAPQSPAVRPPLPSAKGSPRHMFLALAAGDLLALALAALAALAARNLVSWEFDPRPYYALWPLLLIFPLTFRAVHVLPPVGLNPADELRRLTLAISLVYLAVATSLFFMQRGVAYSRLTFGLGWAFSIAAVVVVRLGVYAWCARRDWWGYPVVVLGADQKADELTELLRKTPRLGLRPVALLHDDPSRHGQRVADVPVPGGLDLAPVMLREQGVGCAVVVLPDAGRAAFSRRYEPLVAEFPQVLVVPNLLGVMGLPFHIRDLGGTLGMEISNRLVEPWPRFAKRALDLAAVVLGGAVLLPFLLLLALLVRLSSRGSALYAHSRIGYGGRIFKAWKFRTMVQDAEQVLEAYLHRHPELREEWERNHKLKDDPRVNALGRFLRKWSLDEFPQLLNVLKGEMSLVGPRPIVEAEVSRYRDRFSLYGRVRPGITGLWQISGRSDTSYAERVALDSYYVQNWTVFLDLYILGCTLPAILRRRGAY